MEKDSTDNNGRGALWMLASAVTFTFSMALIKYLGDDYPATMQTFIRQLVGLLIFLPFLIRAPRAVLRTTRPWYMLSRSAATSLSMILAYTSYHQLGMAEANALSFTRQLFMVPLAMLILREQVGPARIAGTIAGFCGVLVILQPGGGTSLMGMPALYGLLASLLVAWSVVGVKSMSRDHGQMTLLAYSAILGALFTLPPALADWRMPHGADLGLLALMGILGMATQICYIRGIALGDATVLGPIDYTRIIFTSIMGFFLFAEVPSWSTVTGSLIIVAAAAFITIHARRTAAAAVASS